MSAFGQVVLYRFMDTWNKRDNLSEEDSRHAFRTGVIRNRSGNGIRRVYGRRDIVQVRLGS